MADSSETRPANQLVAAVEELGIVKAMPGCDTLSFVFGLVHGISMATDFPEWARAFHLKEHPTEEEQAKWRRQHLQIVELTPMKLENTPKD